MPPALCMPQAVADACCQALQLAEAEVMCKAMVELQGVEVSDEELHL